MDRICNCRFAHTEGLKGHEPGCPMLRPPAVVPRDPYRLSTAQLLREVTGGNEDSTEEHGGGIYDLRVSDDNHEMLYGVPEAIGTSEDFPLTHRPGDYLGIDRETAPRMTLEPLHVVQPAWYGDQAGPSWLGDDWVLLQPEEQTLIDAIKKGITAGELRKAIDRFMASWYDARIDELTAKRREHTKRLGH